ncbi:hypothetical protein AGRHK599_LOCUS4077 [Rhizobium rhizogenes]|uniref:CopL family metal-binding regulatory protein n=1 Tax=Rhizobium rhizogenes TaxID=359 RepID=A0AAN2DF64_RHIRH|nr:MULTISPECIES: hypothetical protein [Rhizobium/Agrobacterium group]MCZ7445160.1 hypothetical protein [Rhizobium rhizogenes]PYG57869.1 hypothetical protein N434_02926 [Rhizobium sp. UGM030330-04]CAD0215822.1 hypothetical protein AGRHK599_LOCUS4077 [Rhizobium rhizogenes]
MALLFRLVMVLSLAGYSVSTVNAAMHAENDVQISQIENDHSSGRGHHDAAVQDHSDHANQHDHASTEKTKNSCCQDYCGVAAIPCPSSSLSHPTVISLRAFIDDTNAAGLAPKLQRPPNI